MSATLTEREEIGIVAESSSAGEPDRTRAEGHSRTPDLRPSRSASAAELEAIPTIPPLSAAVVGQVIERGWAEILLLERPRIRALFTQEGEAQILPPPRTTTHTVRRQDLTVDDLAALVLDRAADAIETHGWIQHDWGDVTRGFCAVGAVNYSVGQLWQKAAGADRDFLVAVDTRVKRVLRPHGGLNSSYLMSWNDDAERTAEEVVVFLRRSASQVRDAA